MDVPSALARLASMYSKVSPRFGVLRMGFSWAFHIAHVGHEELAHRSLPSTPFIRDRASIPSIGTCPAMLVYADNADHIGTCQKSTEKYRICIEHM